MSQLTLGTILSGRYEIIQSLGSGSFGQTFLAKDSHLPGTPPCVVKQLKPEVRNDAELEIARRLFNEEAKVIHKLGSHPQIPQLFAYFEKDREFYLVQEFIDGQDLYGELTLGRKHSESYVIELLKDLLGILSYVHENNVIHRGIKPSNIICRQDGKLVLIDFGAVKQMGTIVGQVPGTMLSTVMIGTPGYMPSEQSAGKPRFSSDVYAVGMTAIQALTGVNPRNLPVDRYQEIIWRDRVKVSDKLAYFLTKMTRYDHKTRYQTASEALDALQSIIAENRHLQKLISNPCTIRVKSGRRVKSGFLEMSNDKNVIWKRGNQILALASGGAFLGGIIAQIPGSIIGAVIAAIYGIMLKEKTS